MQWVDLDNVRQLEDDVKSSFLVSVSLEDQIWGMFFGTNGVFHKSHLEDYLLGDVSWGKENVSELISAIEEWLVVMETLPKTSQDELLEAGVAAGIFDGDYLDMFKLVLDGTYYGAKGSKIQLGFLSNLSGHYNQFRKFTKGFIRSKKAYL